MSNRPSGNNCRGPSGNTAEVPLAQASTPATQLDRDMGKNSSMHNPAGAHNADDLESWHSAWHMFQDDPGHAGFKPQASHAGHSSTSKTPAGNSRRPALKALLKDLRSYKPQVMRCRSERQKSEDEAESEAGCGVSSSQEKSTETIVHNQAAQCDATATAATQDVKAHKPTSPCGAPADRHQKTESLAPGAGKCPSFELFYVRTGQGLAMNLAAAALIIDSKDHILSQTESTWVRWKGSGSHEPLALQDMMHNRHDKEMATRALELARRCPSGVVSLSVRNARTAFQSPQMFVVMKAMRFPGHGMSTAPAIQIEVSAMARSQCTADRLEPMLHVDWWCEAAYSAFRRSNPRDFSKGYNANLSDDSEDEDWTDQAGHSGYSKRNALELAATTRLLTCDLMRRAGLPSRSAATDPPSPSSPLWSPSLPSPVKSLFTPSVRKSERRQARCVEETLMLYSSCDQVQHDMETQGSAAVSSSCQAGSNHRSMISRSTVLTRASRAFALSTVSHVQQLISSSSSLVSQDGIS